MPPRRSGQLAIDSDTLFIKFTRKPQKPQDIHTRPINAPAVSTLPTREWKADPDDNCPQIHHTNLITIKPLALIHFVPV